MTGELLALVGVNLLALVLHYIGLDRRITRIEERCRWLCKFHLVTHPTPEK